MEMLEIEKMKLTLFTFLLQKLSSVDINVTLSDMRCFIKPCITVESQSNIHYMEFVNENPDSEETMLHIAENLIEIYQSNSVQEWVVIAGDGKTFQHLIQIKRHYGSLLKKLLIMPGDWHTIKNYQLTLMKIYHAADCQNGWL
jgi:hypothetical protein